MKWPGEVLSKHKFLVIVALGVILISTVTSANRSTYENYMKNAPKIPWENIPASALTYFAYNMRNALFSLLGIILAFFSGISIGISLRVGFWMISQNVAAVVSFSHGILEIYSVFLAMIGGLLILTKIGQAMWGFFKLIPEYVNWKEVIQDYASLFLFSVVGLFISGWLEAVLSYAILHFGSYFWLVAIINTLISVALVGSLSFQTFRLLVTRKLVLRAPSSQERTISPEMRELPEGTWCICPKCGTYISANIKYCLCGAKLPERHEVSWFAKKQDKLEQINTQTTEKLSEPYWCACPKCGAWIGIDTKHCPFCNTVLPEREK
jgi:uncharacterized membrane protein SpoIIM required for sporulation